MDRRHFLMGSAAAGAALGSSALASPNDTVRVACVGLRGRGTAHIAAYSKMKNVEIAAFCDVDDSVMAMRTKQLEKDGIKAPAAYRDLRKLLEDKSIDAISIATPNHQHTLQTIWACQAGKDVYVEKPCSATICSRRGRSRPRRRNTTAWCSTAARAAPRRPSGEAVEKMREGLPSATIYMARGLCFKWRDTIRREKPAPVPAGVDYDLWLGPASATAEFTPNRFHYNWHWFWEYGQRRHRQPGRPPDGSGPLGPGREGHCPG